MPRLNNWLTTLQFGLLPSICVLCGGRGGARLDLCPGCFADLPANHGACRQCGQPLAVGGGPDQRCGRCLQQAPAFDLTLAPFRYSSPLNWLIQDFKFRGQLHLARVLGQLVAQSAAGRGHPLPELLLPVPLHPRRLRERGFNQAAELARLVGRSLVIPVDPATCRRVRATAPQSTLPAAERRRNVAGAFHLQRPLRARHVAVVDDVMTSGHTADALAATLREGGVETVEVWVAARAGGP